MKPIETERLLIRPFTMNDVDAVYEQIYATGEVWGPQTRDRVADGVMMAFLMSKSPDDAVWAKRAVVLKDSDTFAGQVRLSPSYNYFYRWEEEPDPVFNPVEVELNFAFGKSFWGKSYAYESSTAMIDHAFHELKLPRLVNGTGTDNLRSIALHKRLGFRIFEAFTLDGKPSGEGIVAVLNNRAVEP